MFVSENGNLNIDVLRTFLRAPELIQDVESEKIEVANGLQSACNRPIADENKPITGSIEPVASRLQTKTSRLQARLSLLQADCRRKQADYRLD